MAQQVQTFIVLGDDGRHTSLSRHAAPTQVEVAQIAEMLAAAGHGGWIARMDGDYWSKRGKVALTQIGVARETGASFAEAVEAFQAKRKAALS